MSKKITEHVIANFDKDLASNLGLSGRQRISCQFKIDKEGKVVDVRARGPHPDIEKETVRVVSIIPQMEPGQQKGEAVGVLYALPIIFQVEEKTETKKEKRARLRREKKKTN